MCERAGQWIQSTLTMMSEIIEAMIGTFRSLYGLRSSEITREEFEKALRAHDRAAQGLPPEEATTNTDTQRAQAAKAPEPPHPPIQPQAPTMPAAASPTSTAPPPMRTTLSMPPTFAFMSCSFAGLCGAI